MARQKKIKNIHCEVKQEVIMPDAEILESLEQEIDLKRVELEKLKLEIAEKTIEINKTSAREISEKEVELSEKQVAISSEKQALQDKIDRQREWDNQKVTGRFMNLRCKGQSIKLPYIKHKGDQPKLWEFEDGKVYTIPRGFADQLNGEEANMPAHYIPKFTKNEEPMDPNRPRSQIANVDTTNHKYAFVPVGFGSQGM